MIGQDGTLTEDEIALLRANKNSEVYRVCRKVISNHYAKVCARLVGVEAKYLEMVRGELRGLAAAYNLIGTGTADIEPEKK